MTSLEPGQRREALQQVGNPSPLALCLARNVEIVVPHLEVAANFFTRLMGLQFRIALPCGHGLLLVPCSSIHTACMRFAIDAIMLDGSGVVTRIAKDIRPWSSAIAPRGTRAVLEMTAGDTPAAVAVGEQLRLVVREQPPRHLMRRLSFLSVDHSGDRVASKVQL